MFMSLKRKYRTLMANNLSKYPQNPNKKIKLSKKINLYVLELEDNKYYIGTSRRPVWKRIDEHFKGNGSIWTKKFKPNAIIETRKIDNFDEDKFTKIYMEKYGSDNVRGGSYTTIKLTNTQLFLLGREFSTANNRCYICSKIGHYANNCLFNKRPNIK